MNDLQTTNLILGILTTVSVLQFLMLVGGLIFAYRAYSRVSSKIQELEERSLRPVIETATDILTDVKAMATRLNARTERFEQTMQGTSDRVHDTTDRVKSRLRARVLPFVAFVREFRDAWREDPPGPGEADGR
jgi:hypothetical protein